MTTPKTTAPPAIQIDLSAMEAKAADILSDVRQSMVLGKGSNRAAYAFFTTLLLKLRMVPDWSMPTAATDGKEVLYNPSFVCGLPKAEVTGVCVHECLHLANRHHVRRGTRESKRWNVAVDLAINLLIKEAGFALPKEGCFPGEGQFKNLPVNLSGEEYYRLLDGMDLSKFMGPGDDPGGCGGVLEPGSGQEADLAASEAEWEVNLAQARNIAQRMGKLPAGIARMIDQALTAKVDWKTVLRDFISRHAKNEYRWVPGNRRYVWRGLYLPSLRGEQLENVVLAIDTSGSIGQRDLDVFAGEISGIIEAGAGRLTILYHDCEVANVQTWEANDGPLVLEPKGGGGTSHICVSEYIEKEGLETSCLVCLTDLFTQFPDHEPDYPVLWASITKDAKVPWGTLIHVD